MPKELGVLLKEHNVATTALLANYWKFKSKNRNNWSELTIQQGERSKDLFKDELMQHFVNTDIQIEAEQRLDKRMWLPLATRTRFFRHTVSDAVKNKGIEQIIILGSGFDTLAVRKAKYNVKFFEIDQPAILNCKEHIYAEQNINKNAEYIGLDYVQGDLIESLISRNMNLSLPTLILWEGNTLYLEKEQVLNVLQTLSTHFSRLIITFDYLHAAMNNNTKYIDQASKENCLEETLESFSKNQSPFKAFFEPSEIESICENLGMQCVDHKTAARLASDYGVDKEPYYTAETYSMTTFERR